MIYDRYTFEADCEQACSRLVREKKHELRDHETGALFGWNDLESYFKYYYTFRTWEDSREAKMIAAKWCEKAKAELEEFDEILKEERIERLERKKREEQEELNQRETRTRQEVDDKDDLIRGTIVSGKEWVSPLKSIKEVIANKFSGNDEIKTVVIPKGVIRIGDSAFAGCSELTEITIPDSVCAIGNNAFEACVKLERINIPNSVVSIGSRAFCGCVDLKGINIPDGVIEIGENAFGCCWNLKEITIPDSVVKIGKDAFKSPYLKVFSNKPELLVDAVDSIARVRPSKKNDGNHFARVEKVAKGKTKDDTEVSNASPVITCTKCGSNNDNSAKFCIECGNPLQVVCPKCKNIQKAGTKFCMNCGNKF